MQWNGRHLPLRHVGGSPHDLTMEAYSASHDQHGIALLRALAYLIAQGEGHVTYEQIEGTIHGLEHGRIRFVFEVDGPVMWRTATALREQRGLPRDRAQQN